MNLIIIGDNVDKMAIDIWKGNTNFTVLNKCPSIFDKRFINYIKDRAVIVTTTAEQFTQVAINDFIEFMTKYNFIPLFVAESKDKSMLHLMYTAVCDFIKDAVLYTKNDENKDYNEFIEIAKNYLNGKGMIENEDNSIRAPRKRKASSTKK